MVTRVLKPPSMNTFICKISGSCSRSPHPSWAFKRKFAVGTLHKNRTAIVRGLLKFDLPELPPAASVLEAVLCLHLFREYESAGSLAVHQVVSKWNPLSVCWKHQPLTLARPAAVAKLAPNDKGEINIGITSLLREWYSGLNSNFGVMLKMQEEDACQTAVFHSRNSCDSRFWPSIKVSYMDPEGDGTCCRELDMRFTETAKAEIAETPELNTLLYNYSYVVVNSGQNPAAATLMTSPDGLHWQVESETKFIKPGTAASFIPDTIARFSRLRFWAAYYGTTTVLEVYVQGRS